MKSFFAKEKNCIIFLFITFLLLTGHTLGYGYIYDDRYLVVNFLEIPIHLKLKAMYQYADFHFYPVYFLSHIIDHIITTLIFDYDFFLDPARWIFPRITNLLIHFFNGVLLFRIIKKIFNTSNIISIAAVLFFLIHPSISQPLLNVTSRNESLYLLFSLSCFLVSFNFIQDNNKKNIIYLSLLFFLALCSKALAIYFVILIPLYHLLKSYHANNIKFNIDKIGSIFVSLTITLIFFLIIRDNFTKDHVFIIDKNIIYNFFSSISFYAQTIIFPFDHIYIVAKTKIYNVGLVIFLFLLSLFIFSIHLLVNKKDFLLFFVLSWIGSSLSIPIYFGIITFDSFPLISNLAERYAYGSIPAVSFLITWTLIKIKECNFKGFYFYPIFGFVFIVYSFLLVERSKVYKDDIIFWGKAPLTHEEEHLYYKIVPGLLLLNQKKYEKSLFYFRENSLIYSNSIRNYTLLSDNYLGMGNKVLAQHYQNIIKTKFGGHPMLLMKEGLALSQNKEYQKALEKFLKVDQIYERDDLWEKIPDIQRYDKTILEYQPDDTYFNIGVCYANLGDKENALKYFIKAFEFNYLHTTAKYNAAVILKEQGKKELAIKLLNEAINQNKNFRNLMNKKLNERNSSK